MLHFVYKYFCHPFLNKNGVNLLALLFCILTFKTPPLLRFVVPLQTKMAFDFYLCVSALRVQNAANCVRLAIGGFVATNRKAPFSIRAQQEDTQIFGLWIRLPSTHNTEYVLYDVPVQER